MSFAALTATKRGSEPPRTKGMIRGTEIDEEIRDLSANHPCQLLYERNCGVFCLDRVSSKATSEAATLRIESAVTEPSKSLGPSRRWRVCRLCAVTVTAFCSPKRMRDTKTVRRPSHKHPRPAKAFCSERGIGEVTIPARSPHPPSQALPDPLVASRQWPFEVELHVLALRRMPFM